MKSALLEKLLSANATIGVIGVGYVGLPLVLRFSDVGYKVIGFDIDPNKVEKLNDGQSYIEHISGDAVKRALAQGFTASNSFEKVSECDAIIICVPTPLNKFREPDLSYVVNTIEDMLPHLRAGQAMSLESTTYPGTTEEEIVSRVERNPNLKVGESYFVVYSPEREDPGNVNFETKTIPKVVGGHTSECLDIGEALYKKAVDKVVKVSSTRAAEMTKLLENIHRAVNIGLVNEMKIVADKMNIDIYEVINAAATKPFGFTPYYPGPGLGGHCIPIDPFYLTWKAREYGLHTRFIELAGEVNSQMPEWIVGKTADALNTRKKSLNGSKVLVLGLAYKKNIDDIRESPSLKILKILSEKGSVIFYSDPHKPVVPTLREYKFDLRSTEITANSLKLFDAVILATDHDAFDYELIKNEADLIIDTRGKFDPALPNVIKA